MLDGTARDPQEVLGLVPPALAAATVEKIAINAVMAGCRPEYLPVVVAGGEAMGDEGFDPWSQFLANRGYVVLQPNFRGSTGYGIAFERAGDRQWGRAMQDDLTDGVNFTVRGAERLRLNLKLDDKPATTDEIFIGPNGRHPKHNPFTIKL